MKTKTPLIGQLVFSSDLMYDNVAQRYGLLKRITTLLMCLVSISMLAQTRYSFELVQDHADLHTFTVYAHPNADATDADLTGVGINILLPRGNEIGDLNGIVGSEWSVRSFTNQHFGRLNIDAHGHELFILSSSSSQDVFSHRAGTPFALVAFKVTSTPQAGAIELMSNEDGMIKKLNESAFNVMNSILINPKNDGNIGEHYGGLTGITRYSFERSVSDEDQIFASASLETYPNPTTDYFLIKGDIDTVKRVEIFDLAGKLVKVIEEYDGEQIDVNNYEDGVYLIKLYADATARTIKLIKKG